MRGGGKNTFVLAYLHIVLVRANNIGALSGGG
jgi:hypothetical protein